MTKLLNIDALTPVQKEVEVQGKRYPIVERTVEQVLTAIKAEKMLNAKAETTEEEQIQLFLDLIKSAIPTLPTEVVRNLPFHALSVILSFINEQEEVEEPETGK